MKKLWRFEWYCSYAFIGGLFKATDEEVKNLIGKYIYLEDMAGEYSELYGKVKEDDIDLITDDQYIVDSIPEFGINPLNYIEDEEKE